MIVEERKSDYDIIQKNQFVSLQELKQATQTRLDCPARFS